MTTERRPIPGNRCNSDGIHWAAAIRWCPETSTAHSWPTALRTASTTRSALRGAGRLWNISLSLRGLCAKSNCQRVLTGSDSCRGSCGTHRRVSHQRQCRRKFSVSAVTSDRASLSKLASSEKLLMYRNLLNNQAVVRSPLNVLEIFRQSHEKRRNLSDLLEVIQVITRKPRYRSGSPVRAVPACC